MMPEPRFASRFEILHRLGGGASGEVHLARDHELGREVALKRIPLRQHADSMLDEERNGAILQQMLGKISPQVPQVFAFDDEGEFFWIAMEHVPGIDLEVALGYGPFPESRAIGIAIQLCDFLLKLHDFTAEVGGRKVLGVVHGDLKPLNIRLEDGDAVKVLDFGIARQLSLSRNFTRSFFGTLPYTPPEQLQTGKASKASDLWAVGVILYQMVSGRLPVQEGSLEEVKHQILEGNLLQLLPDACSNGLRWIINTSLQKLPEWRHPSASVLKEHLVKLRDGRLTATREERLSHHR